MGASQTLIEALEAAFEIRFEMEDLTLQTFNTVPGIAARVFEIREAAIG